MLRGNDDLTHFEGMTGATTESMEDSGPYFGYLLSTKTILPVIPSFSSE